ncbi:unnamed protein product [Caenorhabditis sp. 36 PRJEB53466]|nr:unnamed protein product [Caenorhabditis sp. 36 PRJEB53466]
MATYTHYELYVKLFVRYLKRECTSSSDCNAVYDEAAEACSMRITYNTQCVAALKAAKTTYCELDTAVFDYFCNTTLLTTVTILGVVGGVALLILLFVIFLCYKKRQRNKKNRNEKSVTVKTNGTTGTTGTTTGTHSKTHTKTTTTTGTTTTGTKTKQGKEDK